MNVFRGILESACLYVCVSVPLCVCVQNAGSCQSIGRGIKSHLMTALVMPPFEEEEVYCFAPVGQSVSYIQPCPINN